jgi:hypothetical protein
LGDVVGARAAGVQAVVTDAVGAVRQDMDQEAADELGGGERHDPLAITTFGTIVLPSESDAAARHGVAPSGILATDSFLLLVLNPYAGGPLAGGRDGFGPAPSRMFVKTLGYGGTAGRTPAYGWFDRANALADFDPRRWSFWGAAYGDQSRIVGNADLQTHDLTSRDYGFATGADYCLWPNTIVGFALDGG